MLDQEEEIIKQSLDRLRQVDRLAKGKKLEGQKLLGLPSYE